MTHDSCPSRSRKPTARRRAARSPHNARTAASFSRPEFTVTTRKMAARVSCATTGWGIANGTRCSMLICSQNSLSCGVRRVNLHVDPISFSGPRPCSLPPKWVSERYARSLRMVLRAPCSMTRRARGCCGVAFMPVAADDSRDFFDRLLFRLLLRLGSRLDLDRVDGDLLRQIAVTRVQPVGFGQRLPIGAGADGGDSGNCRLLLDGSAQADLECKENADADQAAHSEPNGS